MLKARQHGRRSAASFRRQGLRVVTSSTMPVLPNVNIQAAVHVIGEKGAMMTKEDWGLEL